MNGFEKGIECIWQTCNSTGFKEEIQRLQELFFGNPLILYGAGAIGDSVLLLLTRYHVKVSCFCDKNKIGIQKSSGLPIISPEQMILQYPNANIIVCSVNYEGEIIHELIQLGIPVSQIYRRSTLHLHEMVYDDLAVHFEGYRRMYASLGDDWSKKILLERISCYLTSSPITSSGDDKQYFDPEIITLHPEEIFVDGGMYTGDTAQSFFRFSNDRYGHYYGFEPDGRNFKNAKENLRDKADCTLIKKGLWSREAKLTFSGSLASGSHLNASGNGDFIDVVSLDKFFQDRAAPTFIKMDIEGAEQEALRGAEHVIRNNKPKLAICVYHKPEDIYVLPELIKTFRDDYLFYLRHYSNMLYETVLYAI